MGLRMVFGVGQIQHSEGEKGQPRIEFSSKDLRVRLNVSLYK
jgi:hypothetical protein